MRTRPHTPFRHAAAVGCALLISVFAALPGVRAQGDHTHSAVAAARPGISESAGGTPDRLDFISFEFRAWLRRTGEWHVEGDVDHRGLLCGDYEMGMRFGTGSPGCTNVEWLSEVRYVTLRKQCNDATLRHVGGDTQPDLAPRFDRVTCAERLIRCNGNCK
jgi:hypothetical protein